MISVLLIIFIFSFTFGLDERYHTYEEVHQQLMEWNDEFGSQPNAIPQYPGSGIIYELEEIGFSNQHNLPFWAVKLSYNADIREDEPRILILGQCHAEEILGVEISMEIIDWFLHPLEHISIFSTTLRPILQNTEIWVIPTHNPEGLSVVHGTHIHGDYYQDVTFRKNMTDINLDGMFSFQDGVGNDSDGVDLNRNYGFNWIFGDSEFMLDPGYGDYFSHFDYYRGESPFSETETQAIRDLAIEENFTLSIAYHSSRSGRVAEMVIYSWDWEGVKKSPDFPVIDELGQEIAALIPKEVEEGYYFCTPGKSRKGNAHDWFYTETGCIQYLIEVGTENMQPDEELIEDTIDRNMDAAFHLMNRTFYNPYSNTNAYQVSGLVTDSESGMPILAEIKIDEMDGGMLKPRYTDEFGRYRRLLTNGTYNLIVSARGYDQQEFVVIPSATSVTTQNVSLVKKNEFNIDFSVFYDYPIDNLMMIVEDDFQIDTLFYNETNFSISLPQNKYTISVLADDLFPEILNLDLNADTSISINMDVYTEIFNDSFDNLLDWQIQSGDWTTDLSGNLLSQDNFLYLDSAHFFIISNEEIDYLNNTDYIVDIDMKYEMEWDNDSLYFSILSNSDSVNTYWTDQNWNMHNKLIKFPNIEGQSFHLGFGLKTDETINFRGLMIDQISVKAKGEIELNAPLDIMPNKPYFSAPYPNPFNPTVELSYYLDKSQYLEISIINLNGEKIETIFSDVANPGFDNIIWNADAFSSGIYFVKYELEDSFEIRKITLLK